MITRALCSPLCLVCALNQEFQSFQILDRNEAQCWNRSFFKSCQICHSNVKLLSVAGVLQDRCSLVACLALRIELFVTLRIDAFAIAFQSVQMLLWLDLF